MASSSSKPDAASRTKVVIRRLPPTLPEETFWKSVESWVSENTCLWKRYVRGKAADLNDGHAIFSRAYVLLNSTEAVAEFHKGYDGHVFRSKAGEEFQAVVELAPIQKTSYQVKTKVDARQGTIDTEPDYLSYLESLKSPPEKPAPEISGPIVQPTTTPLLEHLRTHGRSKGKRGKDKATTTSSTDVTARRALASVNAAAAKRAPNAADGPILVAGKGRAVTVASGDTAGAAATSAAPGDGKKKRIRRKGKGGGGGANDTSGESGSTAPAATSAQAGSPATGAKTPRQTKPEKGGAKPADDDWAPPKAESASEAGGGRGGRGGGRGGKSGRGKGEGKDRSAKGAVNAILTKNAEGESTRGGGAGRGRGRGRGGGSGGAGASGTGITPAAAMARIDG